MEEYEQMSASPYYLLQLFLIEFDDDGTRSLDVLYGWCLPVDERKKNTSSSGSSFKRIPGEERKYRFREGKYYLSLTDVDRLFSSEGISQGLRNALKECAIELASPMTSELAWVRRPDVWLAPRMNDIFSPPYEGCGVKCSSLFRTDKSAIFHESLVSEIQTHLKKKTGLSFTDFDTGRIGNIEQLHLMDASTFSISILQFEGKHNPKALCVKLKNPSALGLSKFEIRVRLINGCAVILDHCRASEIDDFIEGETFTACEPISSFEVQIYGIQDGEDMTELLFEERQHILRSMHVKFSSSSGSGTIAGDPKLEEAAKSKALIPSIRKLQQFNNTLPATDFTVGDDGTSDLWRHSTLNAREFVSKRLPPEKSEGRFFNRGWGEDGYVGFRIWLKEIVKTLPHGGEVFIVDPYFDYNGLNIILQMEMSNHKYTVLMNSNKCKDPQNRRDEIESYLHDRAALVKYTNLTVYDYPDKDTLHDRYIVLRNRSAHFHKGWHLSNSLQKACENHPMLITPIPGDILTDVQEHLAELVGRRSPIKLWPYDAGQEGDNDEGAHEVESSRRTAWHIALWSLLCKAMRSFFKRKSQASNVQAEAEVSIEKDRSKGFDLEEFKSTFDGLCADSLKNNWPYIADSISNSNDALHYFWEKINTLSGLSLQLGEHINQLMISESTGLVADPMDMGYYEYFQDKPFESLVDTLIPEYMHRNYSPNYEIYWGLNALLANDIKVVDKLLGDISDQQYAKYYRMTLCLVAECMGGKKIVLSAIQSELAPLRVVAVRLIFSFVRDGRRVPFTFDDLQVSLSALSPEEEMMTVASFLSNCWDKNDRLSEELTQKQDQLKKWLLERLQELWTKKLPEDLMRSIIKLSDKPIAGSASIDITNAYLIPLAEQGRITYDLIGKIWLEAWFHAVKRDHLPLEFPQLNHVVAWYVIEHSSVCWAEVEKYVSNCLRIISHPLADLINYQESKGSRDSLIKLASFVMLCRDNQAIDEEKEPNPSFSNARLKRAKIIFFRVF